MSMSLGNHVEAENFHRYILRTLSKILGAHHPSVLTSMSNLALVLLQQQQRHCEPERPARQVLEHSHQHIETLTTVNNLALVLNAQRRNKEAEAHIRQALKGFRYRCGKRHPNTLTSMANLAVICRDQGSFTEAERLLRESLRWVQEQLGANHPSTLMSRSNLVALLRLQSRDKEASVLDQQKPECWSVKSRKPHPSIAFLQHKCLDLLQDLKGLIGMSSDHNNGISGVLQYSQLRRDDVTVGREEVM